MPFGCWVWDRILVQQCFGEEWVGATTFLIRMHGSKRYLVQALNTISFVVNRRSNDNSRLATERLVWGFGQEVYGETMNTSVFFSVTPRRLDESILKRSDGLGTVKTIIWAFYFR